MTEQRPESAEVSAADRADLAARLRRAADELHEMATSAARRGLIDCERLLGKREGVKLALSYLNEYGPSVRHP